MWDRQNMWDRISRGLLYLLGVIIVGLVVIGALVMVSPSALPFFSELFGTTINSTQQPVLNGTAINNTKQPTLKFIGWLISGCIALIATILINRRANAQIKSSEAQVISSDAQMKSSEAQITSNELTRQRQSKELFNRAAGHLGNDRAEARIVAFYELHSLARAEEDLRERVFEVLCAHLRQITTAPDYAGIGKPTEEVQTLLDLLFGSDEPIFQRLKANLRRVNLVGAHMVSAHMPNTDFTDACLIGANMSLAKLHNCNFCTTKMHGANLTGAELLLSKFTGTKLYGSQLYSANFQLANFLSTDFRGSCCGHGIALHPFRTQMQGLSMFVPLGNQEAYMGGVSNDEYEGFQSVIEKHIGKKGCTQEIMFGGCEKSMEHAFKKDVECHVKFLEKNVSSECTQKYLKSMGHYMKASETSNMRPNIDISPYTKAVADGWIKEYNQAMGKP